MLVIHAGRLLFELFLHVFASLLELFLCRNGILIIRRNDLARIDDADIARRSRIDRVARLHDSQAGDTEDEDSCDDSRKNLDIAFLTHFRHHNKTSPLYYK